MPINLEVEIKGVNHVRAFFDGLGDKMPMIQHYAMINAGERARDAVQDHINAVLDRPTPLIQKSTRLVADDGTKVLKSVGRRSIGMPLKVWLKDTIGGKSVRDEGMAERVLRPHIEGGSRAAKPSEHRLRDAGILKSNEYLVPSRTAPLNKYGNVTSGEIVRMLSDLRTFNESGYDANRTANKRKLRKGRGKYFVLNRGGMKGIFKMVGTGGRDINMVFLVVSGAPKYKKRLDFYGVAQTTFDRHIEGQFDKVYARELAKLK